MAPLGMPGIICTRVNRRRISNANSSLGAGPAPAGSVASDIISRTLGFALDDQLGRPLARDAFAAAGETRQDRSVPEPDDAFAEQPLPAHLHHRILVVAGEADVVRWLPAALGDEGKGAHLAALAVAGDLSLGDMV